MSTRSRTLTRSAVLALSPDAVWAVLGQLSRWPQWNHGVRSAHLDGELAVGTSGAMGLAMPVIGAVHERTAPPMRVAEVAPGSRLVLEQPQPGGSLQVQWQLEAHPAGCRLTQRLVVDGTLAAGFAPVVERVLGSAFHLQAVRLYRLAGGAAQPRGPKVVIAGGSGALGQRLAADLACRGLEVVVLTRQARSELPFEQAEWDGVTVGTWARELADPGRTAVVNLAGRLVDVRPTPTNIAALTTSRVQATRALVEASQELPQPLAHWVQASTTAIYSDAGETRCDEGSAIPVGLPQMTGVAKAWEEAFAGANTQHGVVLRTSLVLDRGVPVMQRLVGVTKAGLGGPIAGGRQWFSWIHIEDWLAVVRAALGLGPAVHLPAGVVIAAAPHPERNQDVMRLLRRHLHRPWAPPTPELALRAGSVLMRSDPALGATGRHATSAVLADIGFRFAHPDLDGALADLLS